MNWYNGFMASIDKIYGTKKQWHELNEWLQKNNTVLLRYMYYGEVDSQPDDVELPIANFSKSADLWLMMHCPIEWVRERLSEQYNIGDGSE